MTNLQPAETLPKYKWPDNRDNVLNQTGCCHISTPGTIEPQLYNMEPDAEPEMALNIDFDLHQMENF